MNCILKEEASKVINSRGRIEPEVEKSIMCVIGPYLLNDLLRYLSPSAGLDDHVRLKDGEAHQLFT